MPRTISSGTLSSGSSTADANGCKSSGLCESYTKQSLCICQGRLYERWVADAPYQVSSHNQSIAEHFEQKCLSDDTSFSCGVSRFNTALYILSLQSAISQNHTVRGKHSYEMSPFPLVIWSVSACAPRLIDPPAPPTLRQIEHIQS